MFNRTRVKTLFPAMILSLLIVNVTAWHSQFEIALAGSSAFELDKSFLTETKPFISLANSSICNRKWN